MKTAFQKALARTQSRGYTKEQYRLLFGFDHERLRAGGESLLKSEGETGSHYLKPVNLQNLQTY